MACGGACAGTEPDGRTEATAEDGAEDGAGDGATGEAEEEANGEANACAPMPRDGLLLDAGAPSCGDDSPPYARALTQGETAPPAPTTMSSTVARTHGVTK